MIPDKLLENFKYRFDKLPKSKSVLFAFPDIAAYADVFSDVSSEDCDPELMMKYMMLMYVQGSPAVEQHPENLGKRKTYVMELLDIFPETDGSYTQKGVNDLLTLRSEGVRRKIALFLSLQNSVDWAIICNGWETLIKLFAQEKLLTDPQDILKSSQAIEAVRNNIYEAKERMFLGDRSKALEDAVEKFRAHRNLKIRPEELIFEGATVAQEPRTQSRA